MLIVEPDKWKKVNLAKRWLSKYCANKKILGFCSVSWINELPKKDTHEAVGRHDTRNVVNCHRIGSRMWGKQLEFIAFFVLFLPTIFKNFYFSQDNRNSLRLKEKLYWNVIRFILLYDIKYWVNKK